MDNYDNYWNMPGYNRSNAILRISNNQRRMINPSQVIPLSGNTINIPNNTDYRINPETIEFEPGIYCISYTVTARIPVAAPTTIPLVITESYAGRDGMSLYASAYNNDNIATVSATILLTGGGFGNRGVAVGLRNNTRDINFQSISIELVMLEISAFKIYDL